jgi:hypothetical protein
MFSIIPVLVLINVLFYIFVFLKKSYLGANVVNLVVDGLILVYYLTKFCYEVSMDSEGINFYTVFYKHRINKADINSIRYCSFLTRVRGSKKAIYILTSTNGASVIRKMFRDLEE